MKLNINVTLEDERGERAVVKARVERHREEVAGDSEASFIAEIQHDPGNGDPEFFTVAVDDIDLSSINMLGLIAEALNTIPMHHQTAKGDYSEVEPPLFRDRREFGESMRRLLHLPKRGDTVE